MVRARSSFSGSWSTPMTRTSSCDSAVSTAAMPTPPSPTTITVWPGCGCPALITAPPPVSTAHPRSDATSGGTSAGTGTTDRRSTTAWVAKPETPRWW
jgi:hypothetical protein